MTKINLLPSKNKSDGFILLPILIMLFAAALILSALTHTFYTHLLLTKESKSYLQAQSTISTLIPEIENQLSLQRADTPDPQDQTQLLKEINTWPQFDNTHIYNQLIHKNNNDATYSSLISIGDNHTDKRAIYELISICSLAELRCNPLKLTLL